MSIRHTLRDLNSAAFWAGVSTFLFFVFGGLTLQISVIQQFDLPEAQARSWIFVTWLTAGVISPLFILRYRQPLGIGWTLPGLVYMGSLVGLFSFEEFVGANLVAGIAILGLGLLGVGRRIIDLVPLPILMGMFAASIVGFVTRMIDATTAGFAIAGPMIVAYLLGRWLDNSRVPPVGLAVVVGAVMVVALGHPGSSPVEIGAPQIALPGIAFSLEAIVTVSIPMVVFVIMLGNVQGLGYLVAQGYRVPADAMTIAVGAMSIVNALFGGHPAAMNRAASAILGGPAAGPFEQRYWSALVAFAGVIVVAVATGLVVALVAILPPVYIFAVAGLAIFQSFEDALVRAFSGPLRFGATVAFGVTLSTIVVAGIPSAFWALIAGIGASLLLERGEVLEQWGRAIDRPASTEQQPGSASTAEQPTEGQPMVGRMPEPPPRSAEIDYRPQRVERT